MGSWFDQDKTYRVFVTAVLRQIKMFLTQIPRLGGDVESFVEGLASAFGMAAMQLEICPTCSGTGERWLPVSSSGTKKLKCSRCEGTGEL